MKIKLKLKQVRLLSVLAILCAALILPGTAAATEPANKESVSRFIDEVGLLNKEESGKLIKRLDEIENAFGFDAVVVVVPRLEGGFGAREYAAELYEKYDFGVDSQKSGAILLLAMEDRDFGFATTGRGIDIFTPGVQDNLIDRFLPFLRDNDYFGGFMSYANGVYDAIHQTSLGLPADGGDSAGSGDSSSGKVDKGKNVASSVAISAIVALIIAAIVNAVLRAQLKSVRPKDFARDYIRPGSMLLTGQSDRFLYRQVARTAKPKENEKNSNNRNVSSPSGNSDNRNFSSSSGNDYSGKSGKF